MKARLVPPCDHAAKLCPHAMMAPSIAPPLISSDVRKARSLTKGMRPLSQALPRLKGTVKNGRYSMSRKSPYSPMLTPVGAIQASRASTLADSAWSVSPHG